MGKKIGGLGLGNEGMGLMIDDEMGRLMKFMSKNGGF
jgi:hypothetical protein